MLANIYKLNTAIRGNVVVEWPLTSAVFKDQLNSEQIYEAIISSKVPTKNYKDFCPTKQTMIVAKKTATLIKKSQKSCLVGQKSL